MVSISLAVFWVY